MPIYEYRCSHCGAGFEKLEKMSSEASKECDDCGNDTAYRVISGGAGFILKGDGWVGKDIKEKGQRETHSSSMDSKMRAHSGDMQRTARRFED